MIVSDIVQSNSSISRVRAKVELYNGSTLVRTCTCSDNLQKFNVDRVGESKFFGFGICQQLKLELIDLERELTVTNVNTVKVAVGDGITFVYPYPTFYVADVTRDEGTNSLTITAYDKINKAGAHIVSEIASNGYTVRDFISLCMNLLGISNWKIIGVGETETCFDTEYDTGSNFSGTENLRDVLNAIAEITQTVYYMDNEDELVFKRLDIDGEPVLSIDKNDYFSLDSKELRTLTSIVHTTELGDNVEAALGIEGSTQYIRNNPFWDLREDIGTLVENASNAINGLEINQFVCDWVGNYLLEIGDKIALVGDNGTVIYSYVLDDSIAFDGTLEEITQWEYDENAGETATNPTSLGDALKQTYARVDKANKEIELVAAETRANTDSISSLRINTESISASVANIKTNTEESILGVYDDIGILTQKVNATMTSDEVKLEIQSELANGGVTNVKTNTGFTFNDEGLLIEKSGSEMTTQITEDGMTVYKDNSEVLVANNIGVSAVNLHASTYLIVGDNSRFEDYGTNRTGCFWIGL